MSQELLPTSPVVSFSEQIEAIPVQDFDASGFWRKLKRVATRLTQQGVERALLLYFAARRPETPAWAKATVYAALAYFVMPIDSIPDLTPGIGYSDDLMLLAAALSSIAAHIDDAVRTRAQETMQRLWPDLSDTQTESSPPPEAP